MSRTDRSITGDSPHSPADAVRRASSLTWSFRFLLMLAVAAGIGLLIVFLRQEAGPRARIQERAAAAGMAVMFEGTNVCPEWIKPRGPEFLRKWLVKHWLPLWERTAKLHVTAGDGGRLGPVLGRDVEAFHGLKAFHCRGMDLHPEDLAALAPRVQRIELVSCRIGPNSFAAFDGHAKLEELAIHHAEIASGSLVPVAQEPLRRVELGGLSSASLQICLDELERSPLQELTVNGCDCSKLRESRRNEPFAELKELTFRSGAYDRSSLLPFAGAPRLETILFERSHEYGGSGPLVVVRLPALTSIRAHRARLLTGLAMAATPSLTRVELNHVKLDGSVFNSANLPGWKTVEVLKLPHSGVTGDTLARIAAMPSLRHLDVRHFSDELLRRDRLFEPSDLEVLSQCASLESIDVSHTLTEPECESLQRALPSVELIGERRLVPLRPSVPGAESP